MWILRYFDDDETTSMTVSASRRKLVQRATFDGFEALDETEGDVISVYEKDSKAEVGIIGKVQVAS